MQYRDITQADIPLLLSWLKKFNSSLEFPGQAPINDEVARGFFGRFINNACNAAIIAEHNGQPVAALGFTIMPHPWTGKKILFKAFWYSEKPGAGIRLLRYVIEVCRASDVHHIVAGSMLPNSHRLLENEGFKPCEMNYVLEL